MFKRCHLQMLSTLLWLSAAIIAPSYAHTTENTYDAELANALGADDYGMKSYVLVLLVTGDATISDEQQRNELFRGHFANMARLAKDNILVVAGPLMRAEPKRGLFILNVASVEEAEVIVKTDPAVQAGIFSYELSALYSSAALMQVGEIHNRIQKLKIE